MTDRKRDSAIFLHRHPYPPSIPEGVEKLIVGTLPPPRFSLGELREKDVDFCYGSCDGQLWPVLDRLFDLKLRYDNSREAVAQRLSFLEREKIGICDIVESCWRKRLDAADATMEGIVLRDVVGVLQSYPILRTVIFTGGSSKNGPEYLFRRQLAEHGLALALVDPEIPRRHRLQLVGRTIETVTLTSPSNAANRAIGSTPGYKRRRAENPGYNTIFDFRLEQYGRVFLDGCRLTPAFG